MKSQAKKADIRTLVEAQDSDILQYFQQVPDLVGWSHYEKDPGKIDSTGGRPGIPSPNVKSKIPRFENRVHCFWRRFKDRESFKD